MAKKKNKQMDNLDVTRLTRTLFVFIALLALTVVVFDAGNLIPREAITRRWILLTVLLGANTSAWLLGSVTEFKKPIIYTLGSIFMCSAGFFTYWERGMASSSTIYYVLPLLIISTLRNRHALIAFATLSAGTYALAAVKYFNDFFNEGYRVQLWGNLLQYTGALFVVTWLLMILINLRHDSK